MAKRRKVTCARCGAYFRPGTINYHYDGNTKRFICNSCYRNMKRGNRTFTQKYKDDSKQSPLGQPVWAFILKLFAGLFYLIMAFSGGSNSVGGSALFLVLLAVALIAWAVIPLVIAKKNKAMREQIISDKIRVEVEKIENEPKKCPACGATTKGNYCEYCGTKL